MQCIKHYAEVTGIAKSKEYRRQAGNKCFLYKKKSLLNSEIFVFGAIQQESRQNLRKTHGRRGKRNVKALVAGVISITKLNAFLQQ